MSIVSYKKEISPGVFKVFYKVSVEAINRFTLRRVQKAQFNIESKSFAERVQRELWSQCRENRPDGVNFSTWGDLTVVILH